jgi:hypothetical protein
MPVILDAVLEPPVEVTVCGIVVTTAAETTPLRLIVYELQGTVMAVGINLQSGKSWVRIPEFCEDHPSYLRADRFRQEADSAFIAVRTPIESPEVIESAASCAPSSNWQPRSRLPWYNWRILVPHRHRYIVG